MADSLWKDLAVVSLAVGLAFGALSLYAGIWLPLVVVETNSMMHPEVEEYQSGRGSTIGDELSFGRLGTLDPGDLTILTAVDSRDEIETYAENGSTHYGKPGHVIAYELGPLTIIHRAMTYVTVQGEGDAREYTVLWHPDWGTSNAEACRTTPQPVCTFNTTTGIHIPELGIGPTPRGNEIVLSQPTRDGFITMGDNPVTILDTGQILPTAADQATPTSPDAQAIHPDTVTMDEIVGIPKGELPALGLAKMAFTGDSVVNAEMRDHQYFLQIGNMVAPFDLWAVLVLELVLLAVAPFFVSMARDYWRGREQTVVGELSVLEAAWKDAEHERAAQRRRASREAEQALEQAEG